MEGRREAGRAVLGRAAVSAHEERSGTTGALAGLATAQGGREKREKWGGDEL